MAVRVECAFRSINLVVLKSRISPAIRDCDHFHSDFVESAFSRSIWAHNGQKRFNFIESGGVESAIKSANAIGDDRLQRRSGGFVHPEKFTHGTSAQRVKWFKDGLQTGDATKEKLDHFFTVRYSKDL